MQSQVPNNTLSSQDERTLAALSHVSILLPMIGILAPIIIWVTQKDRSRFVAFQALQAIAYQLVIVIIWFGGMACYMVSIFLSVFGTLAISSNGPGGPGLAFFIPFAVFIGLFGLTGILIIYGIVAAVLTFQGKDFRYLLVGPWIERYSQRAAAP